MTRRFRSSSFTVLLNASTTAVMTFVISYFSSFSNYSFSHRLITVSLTINSCQLTAHDLFTTDACSHGPVKEDLITVFYNPVQSNA